MKSVPAYGDRMHERVPFDCPLAIFSPKGMFMGNAANVSLGGMRIKVRELPEPGDEIKLLFKYPLSKRALIHKASVVWVSPKGKSIWGTHEIGIRFTDLVKESEKHLVRFFASP